jgi:uncharacterized protein YndB with AHSA1/START domain
MAKQDANPASPAYSGIRSEAVRAKTGKSWAEWLAFLDRAGARKMSHARIAAHLHGRFGLPGWWCQTVAVGYEQARGLRVRHQRPDGFAISVSRTVAAPATALFDAWKDARARRRWLPNTAIVVRKATRPRSMRITWSDRKSNLEVNFYAKGVGKGQVVVQHSKLPDAKAAAKMKSYWANSLDRLRETLED